MFTFKNGKVYEKVYKTEENPEGYNLYLDAENNTTKVKDDELEKEVLLLPAKRVY